MADGTRSAAIRVVAAPASGQGKTTVTAALARHHANAGRRVRVLKIGPDFLDPLLLARASRAPCYTLDRFMVGDAECRRLLYEAADSADVVLVEGVMGLFDGTDSTAELARRLGLPVTLVVDASAMAQTFGAIVHGLATYEPGLRVDQVVANRIAGEAHAAMLRASLRDPRISFSSIEGKTELAWPERHLGLHLPRDVPDVEERLDAWATVIARQPVSELPPLTSLERVPTPELERRLDGVRIGVALDEAFAFVYAANLDLLRALGAVIVPFSPVADERLPAVDAVYMTGGYPELYAARIAANLPMHAALRAHVEAGKPLVAECGGLMVLTEALVTADTRVHRMIGLLPGHVRMESRPVAIGGYEASLAEGTLRGHSFHYSRYASRELSCEVAEPRGYGAPEAIHRRDRLLASYVHWYFPSDPDATARLFAP